MCELSLTDPAIAVLARVETRRGQRGRKGMRSWPIFLLTLAAVTSSSLSVLSLYQLVALRAEVEGLKSEVCRRREEGQGAKHGGQTDGGRRSQPLHLSDLQHDLIRGRRVVSRAETAAFQSCLQLLANNSRRTFMKDCTKGPFTGIPWKTGLKRGRALEADGDRVVVREEGYYFVYSQVYYMDTMFAMGHVVIRSKMNVVGDEPQDVILFRCIQHMDEDYPFNTCYTGGIAKLEVGDHLELLIPRPSANVSLDGDSTFLGAFKLM